MDPLGFGSIGAQPGPPPVAPSSAPSPTVLIGIVLACCVLVALGVWFFRQSSASAPPGGAAGIFAPFAPAPALVLPQQPAPATAAGVGVLDDGRIETRDPDQKLLSFAFEPLLRSGHVPALDARLVPKPSGNPVYALVSCGLSNTRYAIRWQQRFLTVVNDDTVEWTDLKQEPHSCFVLVPGHCQVPGDSYVMLRSAQNGKFLRFHESSLKLMCSDAPTANTAQKFCWKLAAASAPQNACGCQYDYNVRAVVCTPCGVTNSAAPATPAPLPGPWPELVGWDVDQAAAFITRQFPRITVLRLSCASSQSCAVAGVPPGVDMFVALRYDPLTNRVLFTPAVERAAPARAPAPVQFRV